MPKGKIKATTKKGTQEKANVGNQPWHTQPSREWEQKSGNTWGDKGKQKCKAHDDGNRKAKGNKGDAG